MAGQDDHSSDDGDLEISIAPAPAPSTPRPPRRRTPNPFADEVIHSGEIGESRSSIIRSTKQPALEAPAPVPLPPPPPRPRMPYLWLVSALLVGATAAGLAAYTKFSRSDEAKQHAELVPVADMIGTTLEGAARATQMRAEALATSPSLRAAVDTDAQTLADMVRDNDLPIPVDPGERVDIVQIRDGTRVPLLHLPAGTATIEHPPAAGTTRVDVANSKIVAVAAVAIPKQRSGMSGEVVISLPTDLDPVRQRLQGQVVEASLGGLSVPIPIVTRPAGATGTPPATSVISIPSKNPQVSSLSLAVVPLVVAAAGPPHALLILRDVCAVLALVLVAIFVVRARRTIRARRSLPT